MVPLVTDRSEEIKSVAASDRLKVRLIELSLLVAPDDTVPDEMVTVGAVESYVQLKADEAELVLPAPSVKRPAATDTDVDPSEEGVKVAV